MLSSVKICGRIFHHKPKVQRSQKSQKTWMLQKVEYDSGESAQKFFISCVLKIFSSYSSFLCDLCVKNKHNYLRQSMVKTKKPLQN
jgi:hypothetical protein